MRPVIALAVATIAAAILFVGFPGIDLAVSRAVFLGDRQFLLTESPVALAINAALPTIVLITVAAILGAAVAGRLWRIAAFEFRRMLFLVLGFAIGPGLVVNVLLKPNWGRARPNDIVEFGGAAQFSPALLPADQCAANCSFVSGDVSIAFAYVAIAMLLPARWRPAGIAAALLFGTGMGGLRLLQGAHFLSDVVFAALFTLLPIAILARLLLPGRR
jgi:lipid A 4'-phosphatase